MLVKLFLTIAVLYDRHQWLLRIVGRRYKGVLEKPLEGEGVVNPLKNAILFKLVLQAQD